MTGTNSVTTERALILRRDAADRRLGHATTYAAHDAALADANEAQRRIMALRESNLAAWAAGE